MSLCFANHILFDVDGPSRARVEFDAAAKLSENQRRAIALPSGPVAQLGARFHGMEEVVGSIPTRSTIFSSTCRYPVFQFGSIW